MKNEVNRSIFSLAVIVALIGSACSKSYAGQLALDFTGGQTYFASNDNISPYTVGWKFSTSQTMDVSGLGFWDQSNHTLGYSHDVGLWSSSGSLLASTTITATSTPVSSVGQGQWLFNEITRVTLLPGIYYVGASYGSNDNKDDYAFEVTNIQTAPGVTYISGKGGLGSGLTFPTLDNPPYSINSYFGANLEFSPPNTVPEPTSFALLGLGGIGMAIGAYRRRRMVVVGPSGLAIRLWSARRVCLVPLIDLGRKRKQKRLEWMSETSQWAAWMRCNSGSE